MNEFTRKKEFEDSRDYLIRLFENKDIYGLTCNDIADLINTASGNNFKESTYRKYYKAFNIVAQLSRQKSKIFIMN